MLTFICPLKICSYTRFQQKKKRSMGHTVHLSISFPNVIKKSPSFKRKLVIISWFIVFFLYYFHIGKGGLPFEQSWFLFKQEFFVSNLVVIDKGCELGVIFISQYHDILQYILQCFQNGFSDLSSFFIDCSIDFILKNFDE